ncbi:Ferredoxin--NADP(+) reductase [plant metagenome]|uniref:ferredoxin--NADP(+) reductase n=2 Tax=root TaxID=1 RepID=A0A1C3K842_9BURK|nr:ferredoxin--NADP reductase [Orrella dioscoreae]SBT27680.1 Ferredoxin--NADP(+) reductase [Orrella dioscoreae]SOE48560.1 Ferredoxin--NADP(+) reductase [Orrella dioscoreae]
MSAFSEETVLHVHHWNDSLFSIRTTRPASLRFVSGQFVMIGLQVDGRPLLRAYSIASATYDEHLEFFSIKVQDGPLTSRLQHLKEGDTLLVGRKTVGTLLVDDLKAGKHLYLFGSGTGLAPFLSVVQDPLVYERFDRVVIAHSVRRTSELAYADFLASSLREHELVGEAARDKLIYYPTVTREPFRNQGRLTELIHTGKLFDDLGLPPLHPDQDRAMICGSPSLLDDLSRQLDGHGLQVSAHQGAPGDYVIERAFVEK